MKIILKKSIKGMIYLKRKWLWIIGIFIIIASGILVDVYLHNNKATNTNNTNLSADMADEGVEAIDVLEITNQKKKTTPNTLIIYKTYYTKCNHYINEYKDIDISAVNLDENEIRERNKEWRLKEFTPEQIILEREEEKFCNQHYKLKLVDTNIVIFIIDENGNETEYEKTEIASEYLTQEDILRLNDGIIVYGKENLTSVLEDYE